jgi:hypothetical protein
MVEAGSFAGGTASQDVQFGDAFNSVPVLMTTVASDNEPDTISGRLSNITTSGFSYMFREQERNWNSHARETVHFIAWEPGRGTLGPIRYEVARAAAGLTDRWTQITFNEPFGQAPLFLAHLQTLNETDTAGLRARTVTPTGVPLKVEEEKSRDWETTHAGETVGYLAFDKAE